MPTCLLVDPIGQAMPLIMQPFEPCMSTLYHKTMRNMWADNLITK